MWKKIRKIPFVNNKAQWIGWFVTVHLASSSVVLLGLLAIGINPTLLVSVIGAPLWIAVSFSSKYITDRIVS